MPKFIRLLIDALTVFLASAQNRVKSTIVATQAPLLKLYASEAYSSCPPANAWLSQQVDKPASARHLRIASSRRAWSRRSLI